MSAKIKQKIFVDLENAADRKHGIPSMLTRQGRTPD